MSRRKVERIFFVLLFFLVLVSSSYADETVGPGEKIQDAIDKTVSDGGGTVFVLSGIYDESIYLPSGVNLKGEHYYSVTIKGKIVCLNSDTAIENLTILYPYGESITYTNLPHYSNFTLLADAGITAVDSDIAVKNCKIMPDLELINGEHSLNLTHYGKAIQIWNMYDNPDLPPQDVAPQIEGNLIKDTDCGIYYFSQASGGAINGEIKNNTFYHNKYGVVLRMHKENPEIKNNIFDGCANAAICFIYEDGTLLNNRKVNILHNLFYDNLNNLFIDSSQTSPNLIGLLGNIQDNPRYVEIVDGTMFYLDPDSPASIASDTGDYVGAYPVDAEPPAITILYPSADDKKFMGEELTVTGTVSDDKGIMYVYVNAQTANIIGANFDSTLSVERATLSYGLNSITATVHDLAGRTAITEPREIYIFRTPIAPPQ